MGDSLPIRIFGADLVDPFTSVAVRELREVATEIVRRFVPKTGAIRLCLVLSTDGAFFIASFVDFVDSHQTLPVLRVTRWYRVVVLGKSCPR